MQARIVALLIQAKDQGIDYVSGGDIARQLGISRSAVWKYIEAIRNNGAVVDAVPGKGYQLVNSDDLLLPGAIIVKTDVVGCEYVLGGREESSLFCGVVSLWDSLEQGTVLDTPFSSSCVQGC